MSLCISLIGEVTDDSSQELADDVNLALNDLGVIEYEFTPQVISDDILLPSIDTKCSEIDYLQYVAAKLNEDPLWKRFHTPAHISRCKRTIYFRE
jgi:hypothetical protein